MRWGVDAMTENNNIPSFPIFGYFNFFLKRLVKTAM